MQTIKAQSEWRSKMRWISELAPQKKVAIIGGGLSLADVDLSAMKSDGYVILLNEAWRRFSGDVVFTIDTVKLAQRFANCPLQVIVAVPPAYGSLKARHLCDRIEPNLSYLYIDNVSDRLGLDDNMDTVRGGFSSGHGALNFAYHMNPRHILAFGLDYTNMGQHCHPHSDERPPPVNVEKMIEAFDHAQPFLYHRDIKVINCSLDSALRPFSKMTPQEGIALWNKL